MKIQELRLLPVFTAFILLFAFSLVYPALSLARSGCCSHHGGVCGCGCCDGSHLSSTCAPYYPQCSEPVYVAPVATKAPVFYTPKPTIRVVATPTPAPQPTESPTPQVQGVSVSPSPSPTPTPGAGSMVAVLAFLAVIIGLPIWVIVKIVRKFRKPKIEI